MADTLKELRARATFKSTSNPARPKPASSPLLFAASTRSTSSAVHSQRQRRRRHRITTFRVAPHPSTRPTQHPIPHLRRALGARWAKQSTSSPPPRPSFPSKPCCKSPANRQETDKKHQPKTLETDCDAVPVQTISLHLARLVRPHHHPRTIPIPTPPPPPR